MSGHRLGLTSVRGHHFLAGLLGPASVVVDLGAHRAEFSKELARVLGCPCHAVEANPDLYAAIEEGPLLRKHHLAIGAVDGPVRFLLDRNPERSHVLAAAGDCRGPKCTVRGLRLETFLREQGIQAVDLLKVDIEGAEVPMFRDISDSALQEIGQISVEFHDFDSELGAQEAVNEVMRRIRQAGFSCTVFSRRNRGDVLFVNRARVPLGAAQHCHLRFLARYTEGISRLAKRGARSAR